MQKHRIRYKSKKGASMVLAIALVLVLFLTTGSFLSIAMLQQRETGSQLNTRQAYVSAKSALDLAQELLVSDKLDVPSVDGKSLYYVLYYDASGNVAVSGPFNTAQEALDEINRLKGLGFTIVGNSYIKVTKKPDNTVDMSAFSTEGKYTSDSDDKRDGDLSINIDVIKEPIMSTLTEKVKINIDEPPVPEEKQFHADGSVNDFLMVGAQTNYSLTMSEKNLVGWKQQLVKQTDDEGGLIFQMNNNATGDRDGDQIKTNNYDGVDLNNHGVVESRFPIVFTHVVKNDTNSNRSIYKAYNQGIYFLGSYTGWRVGPGNGYKSGVPYNASYFTNNDAWGLEIECEFLTIANDMVSRTQEGHKSFVVRCSGTKRNRFGVVVRFLNDVDLDCYDKDGNKVAARSQHYDKGYYWIPNGEDLFNPVLFKKLTKMHIPDTGDYEKYEMVKDLDIYDKAIAGKDMHSAFEGRSYTTPVSILTIDSVFTHSNNTYSKTERTSAPTTDWQDYSIYCAPNKMPSDASYDAGYYDMYSKDFSFLWHNINQMVVNNGVNMSIRSDSTTLLISPKTDDEPNSGKQTTMKGLGGSFWIRPYWGKTSATLAVKNDFTVEYPGGSYVVKKGLYPIEGNGINLMSDEGKKYINDHLPKEEPENKPKPDEIFGSNVDIKWTVKEEINVTDENGNVLNKETNIKINETDPLYDQSGKYITFSAEKGKLGNGTYKADVINCYFSNPIETNDNTTFKANYIMIRASEIKGKTLYIDTTSNTNNVREYTDFDGNVTTVKGQVLQVKDIALTLKDSRGNVVKKLEPGYYFFESTSPVNLMNTDTWTASNYTYITEAQKNIEVTTTKEVVTGYNEKIEIGEGRYY